MKIYASVLGKFGPETQILVNPFMARPEGTFLEKNGEGGQLIAQKFVLVCCVLEKTLMG